MTRSVLGMMVVSLHNSPGFRCCHCRVLLGRTLDDILMTFGPAFSNLTGFDKGVEPSSL